MESESVGLAAEVDSAAAVARLSFLEEEDLEDCVERDSSGSDWRK